MGKGGGMEQRERVKKEKVDKGLKKRILERKCIMQETTTIILIQNTWLYIFIYSLIFFKLGKLYNSSGKVFG